MKKQNILIVWICGLLLIGCSNNGVNENIESPTEIVHETMTSIPEEVEVLDTEPSEENNIQISNPWKDCNTISEAEELAGFEFNSIESAEINKISVMQGEFNVIQAKFYDGDNEVTIRKANTSEDISGDFREFHLENTEDYNGVDVKYRILGSYVLGLTWMKDGFSYSISCEIPTAKDIINSYLNVVFE